MIETDQCTWDQSPDLQGTRKDGTDGTVLAGIDTFGNLGLFEHQ